MKFVSTRGSVPSVTLSQALRLGAAPDGGLFMPEALPWHSAADFDPDASLASLAADWLRPFFAADLLAPDLDRICGEAFTFPVPIVTPDTARPHLHALELFHGPTGAFKDFGARFLMGCFDRLAVAEPLTVLAATSGDTGGAVGAAADGHSSVRALILYPKGRISPFQERQLTCWGDNVTAIEVDGDFDECQRLAKEAFADSALSSRHRLTSANSINLGRLLPQAAYIAHAAIRLAAKSGVEPGFIIPSGNLGHGFATLLARAMGAPVGPIVLATNANATLGDWSRGHGFRPRPSVATLANAMDVGNPSNFERLLALGARPADLPVEQVNDSSIAARITEDHRRSGYVWCPHSASAAEAYERLARTARDERPWIAAATAHPFKFAEIVEPLIGRSLEAPPQLAAIAKRPTRKKSIAPTLSALRQLIECDTAAD